jgi:AraC-like DNA-binding protein
MACVCSVADTSGLSKSLLPRITDRVLDVAKGVFDRIVRMGGALFVARRRHTIIGA